MGGDGYYPEYYLRKRKRDQLYTNVTRVVVSLVAFGGLGILSGFLLYHYVWQPKHSAPGITKEMADTRKAINTEQQVAAVTQERAAQPDAAAAPVQQYKPVDLSAVPYSDTAFPATSVSLQSGDSSAPAGAATPTKPSSAAPAIGGEVKQIPSSGTVQTPPPAGTGAEPGGSPEPAADSAVVPDEPPAPAKPDDNAAKAAEKKAADKKAADAKKAEAAKAATAAKLKDEQSSAPDKAAKAVQPAKYVYRVYGGSAGSKEKAESLKRELSTQGYAGSILAPKVPGADYLILVATVDDFKKADALSGELQKRGFAPFTTKLTVKP